MKLIDPWKGTTIADLPATTASELDAKLTLLEQGRTELAAMPAHERAVILRRLSGLLAEHADEMATLITREMGKAITQARGEMARAVTTTACAADEALQIRGEVLDSDTYGPSKGKWGIVQRRPLGIVLAITPFNFPVNLALHKIGPAFAAGCPVLFKPNPATALSARRLVELCHLAGMPASALQLAIPELEVLREVVRGERVQVISFTGGVDTARAIARDAGPKKLLLELGGNDPLIVFEDGDLDAAATAAVRHRFSVAGQVCTASKRVFVHTDVYEGFRERVLERTERLVLGDPLDEATEVGPVANTAAADEVMRRIADAIARGGRVLIGNKRQDNLVWPTVLEGVPDHAEVCADETFGPVMPLFRFDDEQELVRRVNQTPFGLQAGIFTRDLHRVRRMFEALDVGTINVGDGPATRSDHFPFGGVKSSGLGREGLRYCIEELTYLKTLVW